MTDVPDEPGDRSQRFIAQPGDMFSVPPEAAHDLQPGYPGPTYDAAPFDLADPELLGSTSEEDR